VSDPVELGGENDTNIIEIDESLFGKKRKYQRVNKTCGLLE
jgi:hypothetical protein